MESGGAWALEEQSWVVKKRQCLDLGLCKRADLRNPEGFWSIYLSKVFSTLIFKNAMSISKHVDLRQ